MSLAGANILLHRLPISWPGMREDRQQKCLSCEVSRPGGCIAMDDCGTCSSFGVAIRSQHRVTIVNGIEKILNWCPLGRWPFLQLRSN